MGKLSPICMKVAPVGSYRLQWALWVALLGRLRSMSGEDVEMDRGKDEG